MADDRLRAATLRLSILQYGVIGLFTILALGFWLLMFGLCANALSGGH